MLEAFQSSVKNIAKHVNDGSQKVDDVAEFYMKRVQTLGKKLNSHLFFDEKIIESEVERVKNLLKTQKNLPLAGVPVSLKDNLCTKGMPTTCGSKILENYIPPYDAEVVRRLKDAGALIFGKLNMDEFAMGSSNENSAYGPVKNPWDLSRVPGGSSGGSAAVVAADLAPCSLGSDTGGSIRQPAALCGVVGLKPTYGRVSRYGLVAYGSSLDQVGPFTRSVADSALLLQVLAGWDRRDSTSRNDAEIKSFDALNGQRKLKIGYVKEFDSDQLNPEIKAAMSQALEVYKSQGCEIVELSLPNIGYSIPTYYVVATAEASANLARFDGVRYGHRSTHHTTLNELYEASRSEGFGKEVKQRIMLGTFALSSGYYDAYYGSALRTREMIRQDFAKAFAKVDVIASPTSPTTAFKIGEKSNDPMSMYLSDIYTIATNLAGIPGISIPCGFDKAGLPMGLQLMSAAWNDQTLLDCALMYEEKTRGNGGWNEQNKPNLS